MDTIKYVISIIIATLIGIYLLPWWVTPLIILGISYFLNLPSAKSILYAFLGSSLLWILISIMKDNDALGKISEVTGQILMGLPSVALYMITGCIIGLVCSLMALAGVQLRALK